MAKKYVYSFGGGKADGNESMKNLLGGKGANLAEMAGHKDLRLPVPPGFTLTTDVCTYYYANKRSYPKELKAQVAVAVTGVAGPTGGSPAKPVGTVWFGFAMPGQVITEKCHFDGDRAAVRAATVQHAFTRLLQLLS